ncbi:hypothetical protein [Rickettsia endosymbiont of Ceutorhynchus obstrictus]
MWEGVLRGYQNRHCEEGRSPDAAIQAIPNVMRDFMRMLESL